MIQCSVCGKENDDLAILCTHCRSFLQGKVDTLDLFGTIWLLMESPRKAMKRIVLARNKNYVYVLSGLFGISLAYTIFWYRELGKVFNDFFVLLLAGLIGGPVLGIIFVLIAGLVLFGLARLLKGKATFRNTVAVLAYSSVPIVLSLVLVFPVEVALFGRTLFDSNPSPLVQKPAQYLILTGLDVLAAIWSWVLLLEGLIVANGFSRGKSAAAGVGLLLLAGLTAAGLQLV